MARYYSPAKLGGRCRFCNERVPKVLEAAGYFIHPTCGPSS